MTSDRRERALHEAFEASLAAKAAIAVTETASGVALWLVPHSALAGLGLWLTAHRVATHPDDRVAAAALRAIEGFSVGTQHFFALYLASHGLVKLAVVAALARGYGWAYPLSLVVMSGFVVYQLYRLSLGLSWPLVALTLFDVVVMALIWHEWARVRLTARP